jgi:hypothetical protein
VSVGSVTGDRGFESCQRRVRNEPCGWRGLIQEAVRANEVLFRTLATKRILQKTPWPILRMAFYDLEENSCLAVFVPVSPADNPVWPMRCPGPPGQR